MTICSCILLRAVAQHTSLSNNNSILSQRRTHPLTLHPRSNTILVGRLFRLIGVGCWGTWTTSLWDDVVSAALEQLSSWLDWCLDGGQRKLYIWDIKKHTDTSWCCTYRGSPWMLQAKVTQLVWRSWTRPGDLHKFSMTCWAKDKKKLPFSLVKKFNLAKDISLGGEKS